MNNGFYEQIYAVTLILLFYPLAPMVNIHSKKHLPLAYNGFYDPNGSSLLVYSFCYYRKKYTLHMHKSVHTLAHVLMKYWF